ncbi:hypothetical protein AO070_13300 [Pseudomonas syringae pv. syringae PD2766]|uniref:hypothetical protein n=1 Tax=Pseudomonas syringae TaxID=317 RepID=UPI00042A100D|nr:hypothetical protein [Pseudomonas syringae]KTB85553.1 hypothetical protein AO070_13300 [Pseudomonas syringae pv. syringae PD2766]
MDSEINQDAPLLDPDVPDALDDIPGGEINLLPKSALQSDLTVTFPLWRGSNPAPGFTETVVLMWDDREVARKLLPTPIDVKELFAHVPVSELTEGSHRLFYKVILPSGNDNNSTPSFTVTIDKTAPVLAGSKDPLEFPVDLIGNRVTARYLEDHGNKLPATVPTYDQPKPGDTLFLYWETSPVGDLLAGEKTLTEADMSLDVEFDGDMIVDSGDGMRYASYEVQDRAENISVLSRAVSLTVDAQPVPLVSPSVERSVPAGGGTGTLDPLSVTSGAVVVVPEEIDLQPTDVVTVYWTGFVPSASHETSTPVIAGGYKYAIPASAVPGNIGTGRQVQVYYTVTRAQGKVETSATYLLTIQPIADTRFPKLVCKQTTGTTPVTLKLSSVPNGADFSITPWVYIKAGQLMHMWAEGVDKNGGDLYFDVFAERPLTPGEEGTGVSEVLARSFLEQLKVNEQFWVDIEVSFDEGKSYLNFRRENVLLLV